MDCDAGSGGNPSEKKEEGVAIAATAGDGFDDLEDLRFQCCVCLELLYKPVVIACGHMSCFWCVQRAMHVVRESHCAICRQPYNHFPSICQLLHHLLLKLEPVEYKKREKEVLEYERSTDMYSPQNIEFLNSKGNNHVNGKNAVDKLEDSKSEAPEEVDGSTIEKQLMNVTSEDLSCPLCKELLYQPAVLNCGHVYCMPCLRSLGDKTLKCQVCGSVHPGDFPNICLDLDHFLEEYFRAEYESKRKKFQFLNIQSDIEGSSSGTPCTKEKLDGQFERRSCTQLSDLMNVHIGVGCDTCGVYPIRGKRFKCIDCTESIGFDLCEVCYNTQSKLPGRFNQQHTSDHRMVLDDTTLIRRIMSFPLDGTDQLIIEEAEVHTRPGAMAHIVGDGTNELIMEAAQAYIPLGAMAQIVGDGTDELIIEEAQAYMPPGAMAQIVGDGTDELIIEEAQAYIPPGAMAQIVGDDTEMEESGED